MNRVSLIALLSLITLAANSQITKGNWMLGGNASFSSYKTEASSVTNTTSSYLRVDPNVGYFFANKFAGGIKGLIQHETVKYVSNPDVIKQTYFGAGPFARFYFLPVDKQVNCFAEGSYQFYILNPGNYSSNTYTVSAGAVFFFNSSVGIEFTAAYSRTNNLDSDSKVRIFQLGLGFQIHLEK